MLSLSSTLSTLVVVERGDNWIPDTSDNDNSTEQDDVAFVAVAVGHGAVVGVASAASAPLVVANSRTVAAAVVVVDDEPSKTLCQHWMSVAYCKQLDFLEVLCYQRSLRSVVRPKWRPTRFRARKAVSEGPAKVEDTETRNEATSTHGNDGIHYVVAVVAKVTDVGAFFDAH